MKISFQVVAGIVIGLAGACAGAASTLATATYTITSGSDTAGEVVNATATFVLIDNAGNYSLGITLTNNDKTSDMKSDGQEITGIVFSLPGTSGTETVSGTGNLINFGSNGAPVEVTSGVTSYSLSHWTVSTGLPNGEFSIFTGGQPDMGILPDSSAGTGTCTPTSDYCNGNPSFLSNHLPGVDGAAAFTLSGGTGVSNLTPEELASLAVQMDFGTGGAACNVGDCVTAGYVQTVTPEPGTIGLGFSGLGLLLAGRRRRQV
jgi:MYXO-CTERM domain-containing protein